MPHEEVEISFSNIKTLKMKNKEVIFTLTKTDTQVVITMERIAEEAQRGSHVTMTISHKTMQRIIDFWEE